MTRADAMNTRWVMQDGGDFYVFDAPETADARSVESVWTFAERISDGDTVAATRARHWFLNEVAAGWIHVVWE